jgi:hypothetical protein
MPSIDSLPPGFLTFWPERRAGVTTDPALGRARVERMASRHRASLPPVLFELVDRRVLDIAGVITMFDGGTFDDYNDPKSDMRPRGAQREVCFGSDNAGNVAFIDVADAHGRDGGALFAVNPGAGDCGRNARFLANSLDEFMARLAEEWTRSPGRLRGDLFDYAEPPRERPRS